MEGWVDYLVVRAGRKVDAVIRVGVKSWVDYLIVRADWKADALRVGVRSWVDYWIVVWTVVKINSVIEIGYVAVFNSVVFSVASCQVNSVSVISIVAIDIKA